MGADDFLSEHAKLTRRFFLAAGAATWAAPEVRAADDPKKPAKPRDKPEKAGVQPQPYFTPLADFVDVSRGSPKPHMLPETRLRAVGLSRETWKLEALADPARPAKLENPLTAAGGNALDFAALLKLGERHAARFPKVMSCLNLGCPLGMGLWEGVPLREVLWMTKPRDDLRRVHYYGYHNDDPKQVFRSSLPVGRVLEDPFGLPPVILCYRLNGEWLDAERGGPVRVVVPEDYGFKSIKWLTHLFLSNLPIANDTYADQNNDVDSPMKTFAAALSAPREAKPGAKLAVSGYAQVGVAGLKKVQVSIEPSATPREADDTAFANAPWIDAEILPAPARWGGLPHGKIPAKTHGFDERGLPNSWPMLLTNAHWAAVLPGLPKGEYTFRCRTIDSRGIAQPLPRPFRKSGHAAIEALTVVVK